MQKIVMWISIIAVIALTILNFSIKTGPEPDEAFDMANRNIKWYYAGK